MTTMKSAVIGFVGAAFLAAGPAAAQEFSREGATLGALLGRAGAVVEGTVRSVGQTSDGAAVATVDVARTLAGQAGPAIAVKTTLGRSDSVAIARGERAIFILTAGATSGPAAAATNLPAHEIEGAWLGKIALDGAPEGAALASQVEGYLRNTGAARRGFLAGSLSHWSPRIATDAAVDLLAGSTGAAFDAAATAAIVDALDRNRDTFLDIRPLIALAGRTGGSAAVGPLLDTLEQRDASAIPALAEALERTAGGTNLVPVLVSALERHSNVGLRAKVAAVLGAMAEPAGAEALAAATTHADAGVRRAAIKALASLGTDSRAITALERKLTAASPAERRMAAVALAESGRAGVLRLVAREHDVDAELSAFIGFVRANPAAARNLVDAE